MRQIHGNHSAFLVSSGVRFLLFLAKHWFHLCKRWLQNVDLITASGNPLPERHSVFDTYTGNSCGLFFCSDPRKPPVCLPPDTSLASVPERRSSVSEHDMRSPNGYSPTGIWLLHPAPAISTVHPPSGQPAALGMCKGLKRPRSLGRRWTLCSQLFPLSHMASGLRTTQLGPKRTFFFCFYFTAGNFLFVFCTCHKLHQT